MSLTKDELIVTMSNRLDVEEACELLQITTLELLERFDERLDEQWEELMEEFCDE